MLKRQVYMFLACLFSMVCISECFATRTGRGKQVSIPIPSVVPEKSGDFKNDEIDLKINDSDGEAGDIPEAFSLHTSAKGRGRVITALRDIRTDDLTAIGNYKMSDEARAKELKWKQKQLEDIKTGIKKARTMIQEEYARLSQPLSFWERMFGNSLNKTVDAYIKIFNKIEAVYHETNIYGWILNGFTRQFNEKDLAIKSTLQLLNELRNECKKFLNEKSEKCGTIIEQIKLQSAYLPSEEVSKRVTEAKTTLSETLVKTHAEYLKTEKALAAGRDTLHKQNKYRLKLALKKYTDAMSASENAKMVLEQSNDEQVKASMQTVIQEMDELAKKFKADYDIEVSIKKK